jgi:cell division transport system ATP-binding protein
MRYDLGPEVLRDITMTLPGGSFSYLTGPSGAGKSSLLKLLYLAHRPSRGLVSMFERNVSTMKRADLPEIRRQIGVVYQDFRLISSLSALDNVALPLRIAGTAEADVRRHTVELLSWVGLADRLNARPATLSGGEKQRVAIARAVIARPKLLVADEPTGSVDADLGLRLMYLFEELNRIGTTIVIATHDERLIERFEHPVLRLKGGEFVDLPRGRH